MNFRIFGAGLILLLGTFSWTHFSGQTAAIRSDLKGAGGAETPASTAARDDHCRRLSLRLSVLEGRVAALEKLSGALSAASVPASVGSAPFVVEQPRGPTAAERRSKRRKMQRRRASSRAIIGRTLHDSRAPRRSGGPAVCARSRRAHRGVASHLRRQRPAGITA